MIFIFAAGPFREIARKVLGSAGKIDIDKLAYELKRRNVCFDRGCVIAGIKKMVNL